MPGAGQNGSRHNTLGQNGHNGAPYSMQAAGPAYTGYEQASSVLLPHNSLCVVLQACRNNAAFAVR
jgi:hypothetical protein